MKIVLVLLCSIRVLASDFSLESRNLYIQNALKYFGSSSREEKTQLYIDLSLAERETCRSPYENLMLNCLKDTAAKNCKTRQDHQKCNVISDIILVNKLNEKAFVSEAERLKIAGSTNNYGVEFGKLLLRKYAVLSTDFLLYSKNNCEEGQSECLSKEINRFCGNRADSKNMSWQACVSALIWFI